MMDRYIQLKPLRDMNELTLQSKFIFYFYLKFSNDGREYTMKKLFNKI